MKKTLSAILIAVLCTVITLSAAPEAFAAVISYRSTGLPYYITGLGDVSLWADGSRYTTVQEVDAVRWWNSGNNNYYLFLPSTADLSSLTIWHTFTGELKINGVSIVSGNKYDFMQNGVKYNVTGAKTGTVTVMKSENTAAMFITTQSNSMNAINADKEHAETGIMTLVKPDGTVEYDAALEQIKGRGNSTWKMDKKPYNIKLSKKTSLLGMNKNKKWCLLANHIDQSLIRNRLMFDIAKEAGIKYTPSGRPVDLYSNGIYMGAYFLTQRVDLGDGNLVGDVNDLQTATEDVNKDDKGNPIALDMYSRVGTYGTLLPVSGTYKGFNIPNNPADITGAYMLEFELTDRYDAEASGFVTSRGQPIVLKSPEYCSKQQIEYISKWYQEFEDALYSTTGYNSKGKHYSEYADLESIAKIYVLNELSMNLDGGRTSYFLIKDSDITGDGKLRAGPVWDFDWAVGGYETAKDYNVWYTKAMSAQYLQTKLCTRPEFFTMAKGLWTGSFSKYLKKLTGETELNTKYLKTLDEYEAELTASAAMNFKRWDMLGSTLWGSADTGKTYPQNIDYLQRFLSGRTRFLDVNLSLPYGDCNGDGELTLKDATQIQKHLAEFIVMAGWQLGLADVNKDSRISIKDATYIQLILAERITV